jgi:hypothetical protein
MPAVYAPTPRRYCWTLRFHARRALSKAELEYIAVGHGVVVATH